MRKSALAVGCTMGPSGRTVLIQRDGDAHPIVTKDGVTVSKAIKLRNRLERMGADLIKEAASRTNELAGDGTTTATVLTYSMVQEGMKCLSGGHSQVGLRTGLALGVEKLCEAVSDGSFKVSIDDHESLYNVACISANNDPELGKIVSDAIIAAGVDGLVTVEDAKGTNTSMIHVKGVQLDRGYLSPYFINVPERMLVDYQQALVFVTDRKLDSFKDMLPLLETATRLSKPLIIVADDVEGEALQGLVLNRLKANARFVAVKAPGYGPEKAAFLDDLCTVTGASKVSSSNGLSLATVKAEHLGEVKRVIVDSRATTFVSDESRTAAVNEQLNLIREQLDGCDDPDDQALLRRRLARLSGGVAVVRVGGLTEVEMIERKYRIEDALNATRAAVNDGIVAGGGAALYHASLVLSEMIRTEQDPAVQVGMRIAAIAALEPISCICRNAGLSPTTVMGELKRSGQGSLCGYDVKRGTVVDMVSAGVIDPTLVTLTALQNAASVASTFLSLEAVICTDDGDAGPEGSGHVRFNDNSLRARKHGVTAPACRSSIV